MLAPAYFRMGERWHRHVNAHDLQLLDLSILHAGWLRFPYSVVAASCIYSLAQQPDVACAISGMLTRVRIRAHDHGTGYSAEQLAQCVTWLRPFCVVLRDSEDAKLAYYDTVIREEQHNIQPHDVTITPMLVRLHARSAHTRAYVHRTPCTHL
jgi:hypothetical protein